MGSVDVARWQFAITTVYHFLFVPITIGMSLIVAIFETIWLRTKDEAWYRLTRFFGTLFLINFALGLVTGIVQEFQFGMNWSAFSGFVGDIFGAPLAFEALLAFFMESTFLGAWIFGWGRIPPKAHAALMWITHLGTVLSAYFILAANSFMQNPVGFRFNPDSGRAEMTDFVAILTNKVQLVAFPHVLVASYMTGGAVVMGVALWQLRKNRDTDEAPMYRRATRFGAWFTLVASVLVVFTGDAQGKIMTEVQPMKMAAAEALYDTTASAPFSILSVGNLSGTEATPILEIPGLLSFLGKGDFGATIEGINDLRVVEQETALKAVERYGLEVQPLVTADSYVPNVPLTYWTFRLMMGAGMAAMIAAIATLWATRRGQVPSDRWWWTAVAVLTPLAPVIANSFGWIFTEAGRQPWAVFGLMTTNSAVSPSVGTAQVWITMIGFTVLYAVLAVIEVRLFVRTVRKGAPEYQEPSPEDDDSNDRPLQFAY